MDTENTAPGYHIWGIDHSAYGPVELPTLVNWIKEERVLGDTWIFVEDDSNWLRAAGVPQLKMFFQKRQPPAEERRAWAAPAEMTPGGLRRIKALAELTDEQLAALFRFVEIVPVRPFTHLIHKGDPPDALYGVLEGELRSSILFEGKESPVATLGPGSIIGEISFFDKGPHAVDVISNTESVLIKLSAGAVDQLSKESPETSLALLAGLIKAIAGRVRTLTRRYENSVQVSQRAEVRKAA